MTAKTICMVLLTTIRCFDDPLIRKVVALVVELLEFRVDLGYCAAKLVVSNWLVVYLVYPLFDRK